MIIDGTPPFRPDELKPVDPHQIVDTLGNLLAKTLVDPNIDNGERQELAHELEEILGDTPGLDAVVHVDTGEDTQRLGKYSLVSREDYLAGLGIKNRSGVEAARRFTRQRRNASGL